MVELMASAEPSETVIPPPTFPLLLVEKWARHRGDPTSRGGAVFASGQIEPVVQIHHGTFPIYVRDLGKCLTVLGVLDFPGPVREKLAAASTADRAQFLFGLQAILTACPRLGFSIGPRGVVDPREFERVVLDQTIQVEENDPAPFNRFCDAIQETETILLQAAGFVQLFVPIHAVGPRYSSGAPPPSELYL